MSHTIPPKPVNTEENEDSKKCVYISDQLANEPDKFLQPFEIALQKLKETDGETKKSLPTLKQDINDDLIKIFGDLIQKVKEKPKSNA